VNTIQDLAAHLQNAIDVVVTMHDHQQPLCVDGIISNGCWTRPPPKEPRDPKKGDVSPSKEDRLEEEQPSCVQYRIPEEKEMKMDFRWMLHHVTSTIAQQFGRSNEAPLWLFSGSPSSTPDEPLNALAGRNDQLSLKDLQRSSMYMSTAQKKPLAIHAVEIPLTEEERPVAQLLSGETYCPFCVRFFDDAVREVGNVVVAVPNTGVVGDIIAEARRKMNKDWAVAGNLRVLEVIEGRLHKLCRSDTLVRSLACFTKSNIFYNSLRIEADPEPRDQTLTEIWHCDRQSQQAFAQPLLLHLAPGEKCGNIKARCKAKLQVPDSEFKSWRLVRCGRSSRTHLKDDEPWDADAGAGNPLCLEHVHPNPTNSLRQSRYNKPLTIK
jgi:hypothetical protein